MSYEEDRLHERVKDLEKIVESMGGTRTGNGWLFQPRKDTKNVLQRAEKDLLDLLIRYPRLAEHGYWALRHIHLLLVEETNNDRP